MPLVVWGCSREHYKNRRGSHKVGRHKKRQGSYIRVCLDLVDKQVIRYEAHFLFYALPFSLLFYPHWYQVLGSLGCKL